MTKQFLLTTFISISILSGMYAAEDIALSQVDKITHDAVIVESATPKISREEEIAFEILNKTITVGNEVTYKNKKYTIVNFETRTNEATPGYYNIDYALKKDVAVLGVKIGEQEVNVRIRDGQYPEYPYYKVKNPNAVNDVHYSISTSSYFRLNTLAYWFKDAGAAIGTMAVCGITAAVVTPFAIHVAKALDKKIINSLLK